MRTPERVFVSEGTLGNKKVPEHAPVLKNACETKCEYGGAAKPLHDAPGAHHRDRACDLRPMSSVAPAARLSGLLLWFSWFWPLDLFDVVLGALAAFQGVLVYCWLPGVMLGHPRQECGEGVLVHSLCTPFSKRPSCLTA